MVWLYLLVCLVAGALMPLQAGVNAQLARWVGHPVTASLVSFAVGTLALLAYSVAVRPQLPPLASLASAPWWAWVGGLPGGGKRCGAPRPSGPSAPHRLPTFYRLPVSRC